MTEQRRSLDVARAHPPHGHCRMRFADVDSPRHASAASQMHIHSRVFSQLLSPQLLPCLSSQLFHIHSSSIFTALPYAAPACSLRPSSQLLPFTAPALHSSYPHSIPHIHTTNTLTHHVYGSAANSSTCQLVQHIERQPHTIHGVIHRVIQHARRVVTRRRR